MCWLQGAVRIVRHPPALCIGLEYLSSVCRADSATGSSNARPVRRHIRMGILVRHHWHARRFLSGSAVAVVDLAAAGAGDTRFAVGRGICVQSPGSSPETADRTPLGA
uniref:Uncharacterized protein n=1 Tax=Ralstonia solanacearum CFBP2957 TaxID=859656 RepID=D8P3J7_RALSL|nr:protein of unknown function [Ralstonia solanacearum CFBP2957]